MCTLEPREETPMNSRPTIHQYRRLAEGLLRKALEAPLESKQDFIHHAVSYLAFARAQEQSDGSSVEGISSDLLNSDDTENRYRQVRQLIKQAIEMPTPDGIANFLNFSTSFRRLGIWNARMAYIQRPGARIIASEYEWKTVSRSVVPDAIPIMILWPFSPIRYVYELEDTEPPIDREAIKDPFAANGHFHPQMLPTLISSLRKQKRFKIIIEGRRQGFSRAGSAATHGVEPAVSNGGPLEHGASFGEFAGQNAASSDEQVTEGVPSYRVTSNDRLNPTQRFITIAHELGHIFSGPGANSETELRHRSMREPWGTKERAEALFRGPRPRRSSYVAGAVDNSGDSGCPGSAGRLYGGLVCRRRGLFHLRHRPHDWLWRSRTAAGGRARTYDRDWSLRALPNGRRTRTGY